MPICPKIPSLLSTPSSVKLLLVGRAPLTTRTDPPDSRKRVDSVEVPTGFPPASKLPPPPTTPTKGRLTPGESVASSVKLRCGIGRSVTCLLSMTLPRSLVSDWTTDWAVVTVTTPPTCPGTRVTSTTSVLAVCTVMLSWTVSGNVGAVTLTLYTPGSNDGASYIPSSPVVTVRLAFVATLVIVTDAFWTTPPF